MEQGSCYFYREARAHTTAHTCLMGRVFGFHAALCPECEQAFVRVLDADQKPSSIESAAEGRA